MFANIHYHAWEVVRTVWPYRTGWGIACKHCQLILIDGFPKADVEVAMRNLMEQVHG